MKRPNAAGSVLQALEPVAKKLAEMEQRALAGQPTAVVQMGCELADSLREAGRRAIDLLLEQAARAEPTGGTCACGGQTHSEGFEPKSFIMRFGRVSVMRRRRECDACGSSELGFDKAWSLPEGEFADDVREATERLVCRLGYAEGIEELDKLWGVAPKASSTAQRWVVQDGQRAQQVVREDGLQHWNRYIELQHAVVQGEQAASEREPGFGVVQADGVHVLTWKPGQESRRKLGQSPAATPQQVSASSAESQLSDAVLRHQPPSTLSQVQGSPMGPKARSERVQGREVCVGLVYLGEHACEQSAGHGTLLERRYVVTLNNREGFWVQLHDAAASHGVLNRQQLVWLSDGGSYFIDRSAELFQDQPLVPVLDIQHARQHVWETGHKLTSDKNAVRAWVAPHLRAVDEGSALGVVIDLAEERKRRTSAEQRKALDALSGYVQRHAHMMDYPRYRQAGYPIASAAIESTNKRLVSRRCKQGGMLWGETGLEAILALRAAMFNPGAWYRLWPHAAAA